MKMKIKTKIGNAINKLSYEKQSSRLISSFAKRISLINH